MRARGVQTRLAGEFLAPLPVCVGVQAFRRAAGYSISTVPSLCSTLPPPVIQLNQKGMWKVQDRREYDEATIMYWMANRQQRRRADYPVQGDGDSFGEDSVSELFPPVSLLFFYNFSHLMCPSPPLHFICSIVAAFLLTFRAAKK